MLKTDYKSDVFEGNRKYQISQDGEGKSEILDVTAYSQEGDIFGPNDINATNRAVNALRNDKLITIPVFTQSAAPYTADIKVQHLKTTDAIELYAGLIKSDSELTVAQKAEKIKMRRKYLTSRVPKPRPKPSCTGSTKARATTCTPCAPKGRRSAATSC
mgnify:CR=1 FL=1